MEPLILALDQGTTSSRALLIDSQGSVRATAQQPLPQCFPQPGWVEYDPEMIWKTQIAVAQSVVDMSGESWDQIVAIGITNQRETTVLWDPETGKPLYNAIGWQDRRTSDECGALKEHEALIQKKTGLLLDPYFSALKARWILDKCGCQRAAFGTIDSFLLHRLTGVHATDVTNASRTQLFNIHTGNWDKELLELFGLDDLVLPAVRPSSGSFGTTHEGLFPKVLPVMGIAGDQQAALFGQGCFETGSIKCTYGTGCFLLMHTGKTPVQSDSHLLTTVAATTSDSLEYALEGSVFIGGAAIQWLHEGLNLFDQPEEVDELAKSVPDTAGVYFVPALTGLGAPYWQPQARGTIVGLTRGANASHLARACLEGIAFQVADVIDAMEIDAQAPISSVRVDGGCAKSDLLMQFQSDLLGIPILRPRIQELTALGVAYLAGLAAGLWSDKNEIHALWELEHTFRPQIADAEREERREEWFEAIACTKQWSAK